MKPWTKEQVDEYFRQRGTVVRQINIPATHPIDEDRGFGQMMKEQHANTRTVVSNVRGRTRTRAGKDA
jgi:hypothetical protein